jgi:hypothetical protein
MIDMLPFALLAITLGLTVELLWGRLEPAK